MVSVLRTLQSEWNALVPAAQARGIRRVRVLNAPLETIAYRRERLDWLRSQLGTSTSFEGLTFGVEIEFIFPRGFSLSTVAQKIAAAGINCSYEGYNHQNRLNWKVVSDGSVGSSGGEVVSPILRGEDGFAQLRKVCQAMTDMGCKVNRSCGFHVHVGASGQDASFFRNLVTLYASAEDAIDSFMAPSRRASNNNYCASLKWRVNHQQLNSAQDMTGVVRAIGQTVGLANARGSGRYCKLNLQSFWQHGTVEFRHHQGTVEAPKAENWTRLCLRMVAAARDGKREVLNFDDLMNQVGASDGEKAYFAGRIQFFRQRRAA